MDDYSLAILKLFSARHSLSLVQLSAVLNHTPLECAEPVAYLRKQGFLRIESNHALSHDLAVDDALHMDTPIEITFEGRAALEAEIKSRRHLTFNEIRAWITLGIAIAAFIKSFFF